MDINQSNPAGGKLSIHGSNINRNGPRISLGFLDPEGRNGRIPGCVLAFGRLVVEAEAGASFFFLSYFALFLFLIISSVGETHRFRDRERGGWVRGGPEIYGQDSAGGSYE